MPSGTSAAAATAGFKRSLSRKRDSNITGGPDQAYQREEVTRLVLNALQKLPEDQRTLLIMKEYEGLKFREIAEVLDISENTAKSRLYYGLENLKKILLSNCASKEICHG
ncbi:MAG: RNA polymerase sigma factor [Saprospiraceae bacterium]|nr:RNA polymerase sigma factor [Saprospiraceae bacterium]